MNKDEQKYVSVKDFAAMASVTPQAIYNRINEPSVLAFIKLEKGRKMISTSALELFNTKKVDKPTKNGLPSNAILQSNVSQVLDILTAQLAVQSAAQLAAKDVQIAELNDRLKESNQLHQITQALFCTWDKKRK